MTNHDDVFQVDNNYELDDYGGPHEMEKIPTTSWLTTIMGVMINNNNDAIILSLIITRSEASWFYTSFTLLEVYLIQTTLRSKFVVERRCWVDKGNVPEHLTSWP